MYILVKYQKKKKKNKCLSEQIILTVKDLCRNILSKKMCFHFHDYPMYI